MTFTRKIAKEIADISFSYVLDCIRGFSDTGYDLGETGEDFEQNFEEDLESKGIKPSFSKVKMCKEEFDKKIKRLNDYLQKKYY